MLRDYQNAALSAIRKDYEAGWRHTECHWEKV